jgi:hypothetical protein
MVTCDMPMPSWLSPFWSGLNGRPIFPPPRSSSPASGTLWRGVSVTAAGPRGRELVRAAVEALHPLEDRQHVL